MVGRAPTSQRILLQHLKSAREYLGGRGLPGFISKIKKDAISSLTEAERNSAQRSQAKRHSLHYPPFLTLATADLSVLGRCKTSQAICKFQTKKAKLGKKLFDEGLCSRCHKVQFPWFQPWPRPDSRRQSPRETRSPSSYLETF